MIFDILIFISPGFLCWFLLHDVFELLPIFISAFCKIFLPGFFAFSSIFLRLFYISSTTLFIAPNSSLLNDANWITTFQFSRTLAPFAFISFYEAFTTALYKDVHHDATHTFSFLHRPRPAVSEGLVSKTARDLMMKMYSFLAYWCSSHDDNIERWFR